MGGKTLLQKIIQFLTGVLANACPV